MNPRTGILFLNIGTPASPSEEDVRAYLAEFLSDPYLVDYPRWLWMPILKGIILKSRPARSARLYQKIWQEDGSPLLTITRSIARKTAELQPGLATAVGMRYGQPSTRDGLQDLKEQGIEHLVLFPLYPHYSSTTSTTALEKAYEELDSGFDFPIVTAISSYHEHPAYIQALAASIRQDQEQHGQPEKLMFSFHGIPQRFDDHGSPAYTEQCRLTAKLTARDLGLGPEEYQIVFQSRFGPEPWLQPYADEALEALGKSGLKSLAVICPGFAADCLETLEEIAIEGQEIFHQAGGGAYRYIPALNDGEAHIRALLTIINDTIED